MMDAETREALEASIKHWEENAAATKPQQVNTGSKACALCQMFIKETYCGSCPVVKRTGVPGCRFTPYVEADGYFTDHKLFDERWHWRKWQRLATAELNFLKSLRPTDKQEAA